MAEKIILPRLGNSVEECIIQRWLKKVGATVTEGEPLCEVETDKTSMEISSTASGVLRHVFFAEGTVAPVLAVLAIVGEETEDITSFLAPLDQKIPEPESKQENSEIAEKFQESKYEEVSSPELSGSSDFAEEKEIFYSPRARSWLLRHGLKAEEFSRLYGKYFLTLKKRRIEEGDLRSFFAEHVPVSRAAEQHLLQTGSTVDGKKGSGPAGKILRSDLIETEKEQNTPPTSEQPFQQTGQSHPAGSAPPTSEQQSQQKAPQAQQVIQESEARSSTSYRSRELSRIRKTIAERMRRSLHDTAQLSMTIKADAAALLSARSHYKELEKDVTINDMLLYICARVLSRNIWANSHLVGGTEIREFDTVNLAFAVDTERGLMVPVIREAEKKQLEEISREAKKRIEECRSATIALEDLEGATFTLTNLGAQGIESFTPILNLPQTGILGVGGIAPAAIYTELSVLAFQPRISLSLTFDHRAYDGAAGARLLKDLAQAIANFTMQEDDDAVH